MSDESQDERIVDLDSVNFRNRDVTRWAKKKGTQYVDYGKSSYGLRDTSTKVAAPRLKRR